MCQWRIEERGRGTRLPILGKKKEQKSQNEEKPAGQAKQNRAPCLAQGLDPLLRTTVIYFHTLLVTSEGLPLETLDLKDLTDSVSLPAPP